MYKYIGLDAHSSTCTLCTVDSNGTEIDMTTIATNGRLLVDYVRSFGDKVIITFEECDLSVWLFDLFSKHVHRVVVCNPAENAEYKRVKTDKLDARNLAKLLRGDFLKPVFHDGSKREKFRTIVSSYEDTVQEIVRLKNRMRTIKRRRKLFCDKTFSSHASFIETGLSEQLELLESSKNEHEEKLKECVTRFEEAKYIMSVPYIKGINASKIIANIVDPNRFKNKHKFWAYCGLVKHQRSSGGRLYGSKRAYGNCTLKCVFKMAAHGALKSKGALRQYYDGLREKGVSDSAAKNALARKIAAITISLWKNRQRYDDKKVLIHLTAQD